MVAPPHHIVIAKNKKIEKKSFLAEIWPKPISVVWGWFVFLFKLVDVYVYGSILGCMCPFAIVFNAYYCSTVSGLHVDTSYHTQLASEQKLWWFKSWLLSKLLQRSAPWSNHDEGCQNTNLSITCTILNHTTKKLQYMRALDVYFQLINSFFPKSLFLKKMLFY